MSKKILGTITADPSKIYPKQLSVKLCYLNFQGLREEAKVISAQIFEDFSYTIEYEPMKLSLLQKHFVEIMYNDLYLRSTDFLISKQQPDETTVDFILSNLNYTIEIAGNVKTPRGGGCSNVDVSCNKISFPNASFNLGNSAITDVKGNYLIIVEQPFAALIPRINPDNLAAFKTDLDIQITATDVGQSLTMQSEIFCDVKSKIEQDFVLGDEAYRGLSTAARQKETFASIPSLDIFTQTNAVIPNEQIEYISKKMEIPMSEATRLVNAKNMSGQFNCNEDILFALLDGNSNADYTSLLFKNNTELIKKVNNAIENNTIYISKEGLEQQIADLKEEMITKYIQEPAFTSKYDTIGITLNTKKSIVNATIEWLNNPALRLSGVDLNDYLLEEEIITQAQYNKAVLYDGISAVSESNTALAEKILSLKTQWTKIDDVIAGKSQILGIINGNSNISIPESFATAEEYVEHIDKMLEREYSSQYLKCEISSNNVVFLQNNPVKTFLNNNPDLQFGENHALVTLAKESINLPNNILAEEREQLACDLQKIEQLYQLTPLENKSEIMEVLWNLELCAAHQIASYTKEAFNELVIGSLNNDTSISEESVNAIHNKATYITTLTNFSILNLGVVGKTLSTQVIPGYEYDKGEQDNGGLPTIKDLFGSQDYFQYPASRTLLSPAAYLMDILQFMKNTTNGSNIMSELFDRRPDIKHILLNCSNTDNVMPHIDLVNEILEIAISGLSDTALDNALEELQTRWNTQDLIAFPENTLSEKPSLSYIRTVYTTLQNAETHWGLPFHFWLEEYRCYLEQLSLSREEIIKYFTIESFSETEKTKKELYEYLKLTPKDVGIITGSKEGNNLAKYYKNTLPQGNVHELIGLSGLSYDEIKELLGSHFINPISGGHRYILYTIPGKEEASPYLTPSQINNVKPGTLEGTFILKTGGNINPSPNEAFYDRLHRFERLRKKLNLKVHELDLIIKYLNISMLNYNDILKIAYILKIKEQLKLKLEETLLLVNKFSFFDYTNYTNLYDFIFLKKTENYEFKPNFEKLKTSTTGFAQNFIYNQIPTILPCISGVKISEDTYNTIISAEKYSGVPSVEGLSQIFRIAYLCKSLNITADEYYFLKSVSGLTNLTEPKNLLDFINYCQQIKSYGFSIANLAYIFTDEKIKGQEIALEDEKVILQLRELQKELRNIMQEEELLYEKHISDNLQREFRSTVDKAIKYIFEDFDASALNSPDRIRVINFINENSELFCGFQELLPDGSEKTLQKYFLENGNDSEKKLKAILVGLQLEEELSALDPETDKGRYYSEENIRELFTNIKSHVALEIINGTHNFDITVKDNFLDASRAVEYNPDTVIELMDASKSELIERKAVNNIGEKGKKATSKYAKFTDGKRIELNVDVAAFISNNEDIFPASILSPEGPNNNSNIADSTEKYKNFVFEKHMPVPDAKVADLKTMLSKFLDEADLDNALKIILKPEETFSQIDEDINIRDFISDKFEAFMPVSEAIGKLYDIASPDNTGNGEFLTNLVKAEYIDNYCDRVDLVLKHLKHDELVDAVVNNLKNLCNTDEEYIRKFLFDYFTYNTTNNSSFSATNKVAAIYGFLSDDFIKLKINATDHAQFVELCCKMYKTAQFVSIFRISQEMLGSIFEILYGEGGENLHFDILDIFNLTPQSSNTLKQYLNLATAIGISHTYFTKEDNFFSFFNKCDFQTDADISYIAEITDCKEADLSILKDYILPTTKLYIDWFLHLLECQRIIAFLGVTAQTIRDFHVMDENNIADTHVDKLRQIVKNKYSESEWNKISAELRDPLRIMQRDALRDYLIESYNKENVTFQSSNDLFHYFLIDPEMIPMAKTSRLIQATLSVQLFIQRIFMGMEEGLSFTELEKKELVWRKNYRVWEANRKILFFPENWLDPELRHDKTEIFKSIEEKLLQNDIDDNTVLQAYYDYVEKLEEVSNLEILSAYRPMDANVTSGNFIAFVGRTHGMPHKYFYRTLDLTGTWTPWEEITNGINASVLKLVYWNNNMYMFWLEMNMVGKISTSKDEELIEIKMAYSRYKNGKWTKAVYSDEILEADANCKTKIHLTAETVSNFSTIKIIPYYYLDTGIHAGETFCFNGVKLYIDHSTKNNQGKPITNFGFTDVINNKAICNDNYGWTHFHIEINKICLKLFDYNSNINYHILYENMCQNTSLLNNRVADYIKPIVLEDQHNGKRFIGIPYNPYKQYQLNSNNEIRIVGNEIQNIRYIFLNFYHPYIEEIKKLIQEGYIKLFDSNFQDKCTKSLNLGQSFTSYYGVEDKEIVFPTPTKEELYFGDINFSHYSITEEHPTVETKQGSGENSTPPTTPHGNFDEYYDGNVPIEYYDEEDTIVYELKKIAPQIEDPYAIYNWEMFYHIPMLIADNLSHNMRFEEAQKWYHLIFDPTSTNSKDNGSKRYWKIKPFRQLFKYDGTLKTPMNIQEFVDKVNDGNYGTLIEQWQTNPFNPHLVARKRTLSYMQYVVRKYLENIIAWADLYFTKDTREDINQAALLYILAADILGVKSQKLEGTLSEDRSYNYLKNKNPDALSNVYETIEGILTVMAKHGYTGNSTITNTTYSVSYFAVPHNDKMEECWEVVADRLFKIRNCMNMQGIVRELPLTSPPIDPGAIAAAMATGADLSTALNTLSAPLPLYRFSYMLQKAIEFTNDVKALGNSLLSTLEKCDAEELAILRSTHERAILNAMTAIREKAIEEATKNIEALENSKIAVVERRDYYKNKERISKEEQKALKLHNDADSYNEKAADQTWLTALVSIAPQASVGFPSGGSVSFGGIHLGIITNAKAAKFSADALKKQNKARETDTKASYARRYEDWKFQGEQAATELKQIDKQLAAAQVRLAMAEKELENHEKQMELKLEEFEFMKEKFTNKQLYNWMKGQISKLYQQAYQMAHKLALAAEKALVFEKQKEGYKSFITSAYWDNLKEGLMSGELLYNDLRRLEMDYIETNEREIELTKDISLAMIDPEALNKLREKGSCNFEIPEMLYDIDHPGHYLRRIKSVSVSIPAVTGPYSGVTCKLSMQNNRFRKSMTVGNNEYAYVGIDDTRFVHNIIGIQSIATSSGNNDSGMFEFNFKDERYLPFEGAGAIGKWQIDLPTEIRKFNYSSIADVILHVKYTAKDAGGLLKKEAINNIETCINFLMDEISKTKEYLGASLNLKAEFPDGFLQLCENKPCSLTIEKKHLPFMVTDYAARNNKQILIEDISFSPEKLIGNYSNNNLANADIVIETTKKSGETISEQDEIFMIIKYKIV